MTAKSTPQHIPSELCGSLDGEDDIIVTGESIPERYWQDWTRLPPVRPLALARPRTVRQVSAILSACNAAGTPVVPQGGLTGLVGGGQPTSGTVVLSLERMNAIEEVDEAAGTMTVLAGTPLEAVQRAADNAGLLFAVDIGARGSCTIGGNLATNAGGNRVIRYGMTRDQVLGMEVVLADGTVISSLNKLVKNNTGYDLKHIFIGSEGTLGVITRAVLKLQPKPTVVACAMCAVTNADALVMLLTSLRARLGPTLSAFEAMWPNFYDFMTTRITNARRPFASDHGAYALIEIGGFDPERDEARLLDCLSELMDVRIISDAVMAKTDREIEDLWRIRDGVSELRTLLGSLVSFDVGLSLHTISSFVEEAERRIRARWIDAIYLAFGHLGDNNLHLVVHVPSAGPTQPKADIETIVYQLVREWSGTISAEHGVGLTKRPYLSYSRSDAEIGAMVRIKTALDPNGILNPGKVLAE